jgi:hypothetical protein
MSVRRQRVCEDGSGTARGHRTSWLPGRPVDPARVVDGRPDVVAGQPSHTATRVVRLRPFRPTSRITARTRPQIHAMPDWTPPTMSKRTATRRVRDAERRGARCHAAPFGQTRSGIRHRERALLGRIRGRAARALAASAKCFLSESLCGHLHRVVLLRGTAPWRRARSASSGGAQICRGDTQQPTRHHLKQTARP